MSEKDWMNRIRYGTLTHGVLMAAPNKRVAGLQKQYNLNGR